MSKDTFQHIPPLWLPLLCGSLAFLWAGGARSQAQPQTAAIPPTTELQESQDPPEAGEFLDSPDLSSGFSLNDSTPVEVIEDKFQAPSETARSPLEEGEELGERRDGEKETIDGEIEHSAVPIHPAAGDDPSLSVEANQANPSDREPTDPEYLSQIPLFPADNPLPPPPNVDPNSPSPVLTSPPPTFDPDNPSPFIPPPPPQTFGPESPIPPTGYSPPAFEFDYYNQFSRYRLGIGDNISIRVEGFPEFDVQGAINIEGNLVMPILGNVPIVGLTLEEVSAKISYELGQNFLLEAPEVTTVLVNPRPATITILGEVFRPGFYNLVPGAEVDEAIVAAGGSTDLADLRWVIVRRSLVDGTILERQVNVFNSLQNGTRLPPLRLQDGDSVIVPKLEVGTEQDYDRRLVALSTVAQPTITIRVLSYANEALGAINLPNGSTFVDAITQVGLSFQEADLDSIGLLRFDPEQGEVVAQSLNALEAIQGDVAQNVPLQDEDILVVRRSTFAKIDYLLRVITRPINSVVDLFNFVRDTVIDTVPNLFRGNGDNLDN